MSSYHFFFFFLSTTIFGDNGNYYIASLLNRKQKVEKSQSQLLGNKMVLKVFKYIFAQANKTAIGQ